MKSTFCASSGFRSRVVDGRQYEAREPALKPGVAGAICFDGDAALRPDRYVDELARVVRERGGTIVEQCALLGLDHDSNGVRMRTAQGELRARDAVLALGAWSPRLADAVGLPFLKRAMQPGKGYSITYSAPTLVPKRPLMLRDRSVCVTAWGSGFRLGSTMEFSGYDEIAQRAPVGGAGAWCARVPARAVRCAAPGAVVRLAADELRRRPDHRPVPGRDGLWLATGHGMMGVSMSAGTGQLVADLIAGRAPAVDPTPYRMERFT